MDKYLYWLDGIEGLGKTAKLNLMSAFGCAEEIYKSEKKYIEYILNEKKLALFQQAKRELSVEKVYEEARREGIKLCWLGEDGFPEKLKKIPDAPFSIYYKGGLPDEILPAVAVVGARECSAYGEYVAKELGKMLGQQGIQVISGMARGIDGISQYAALEAGGISFGVLGCGVDICYPKSNAHLYEELTKTGGILSIYPPGTKPQARLFPPRNRIVSGLADVLVVIEARQKSGTAITVEMALEQGRDIYAVPGRITDRLSDGCNKMIKEGAHVFLSPRDFLLDLQELIPFQMEKLQRKRRNEVLEEGYQVKTGASDDIREANAEKSEDSFAEAIENVLDYYPQPLEEIIRQLKDRYQMDLKQEELTAKLMYMCLFGQVRQDGPGWFSKA